MSTYKKCIYIRTKGFSSEVRVHVKNMWEEFSGKRLPKIKRMDRVNRVPKAAATEMLLIMTV